MKSLSYHFVHANSIVLYLSERVQVDAGKKKHSFKIKYTEYTDVCVGGKKNLCFWQ